MALQKQPHDLITQVLLSRHTRPRVEAAMRGHIEVRGEDECWPWKGRHRHGYGAVSTGWGGEEAAHRLAYAFAHETSPWPLYVLHSCDNPGCCNPGHLFLGTTQDNTADKMAKGRHRPAPQPGQKNPRARLTEAQVGEIRKRLPFETNVAIAADYDVSHATISLIRRGRSWLA